jgi:hypothetical protein
MNKENELKRLNDLLSVRQKEIDDLKSIKDSLM